LPAYPWETDLKLGYYQDACFLIASFVDAKKPVLGVFGGMDKQVEEIEILID